MGGVIGSRSRRRGGARRKTGIAVMFGGGLAAALLLFGAATASALVPGDTATISGGYSSYATTSSSDPAFAPCTALPPPTETFWAFVNGKLRITADLHGSCSSTSSPDPSRSGVTDYALTYSYAANWGIVVSDSDVGTTLTLTMSFHAMDNVVATETYQITAPPTTTDTTTAAATTTTAATTALVTTAPTDTAPAPPESTGTVTVPAPPPPPPPPPPPTTSAASTGTLGTTSTAETAFAPPPKRAAITTAGTIRTRMTGGTVAVTIETNVKRKSLLCYRPKPAGRTTCTVGYGTWTVRLAAARHTTIKRLFLVKVAATVVAQKVITIRVG